MELQWEMKENPYTAGYVIERSRRAGGIYEVLTPDGISRKEDSFTDKTVQGGFTYYYRIRSVNPRGNVGVPSDIVAVFVETDGIPDRPEELSADVKPTKVRLSWRPEPLPVAGYIVEKRMDDDTPWSRLNTELVTLGQYDDKVNLGDYGTREYRIIAVAFGNRMSKPSKAVSVKLAGHEPVPAPLITNIYWEDGKVILNFRPSVPVERTETMMLVRGNSVTDRGLVIEPEIDSDETSYEDSKVRPGKDYWYGLIAVNAEGVLSDMGRKKFIRTGSLSMPVPDKPEVELVEKPFRHVEISFDEPEGFLRVVVMRRLSGERWVTVARDVTGVDKIVDADPPASGDVEYCIAFTDENHSWSQLSASVSVHVD